MERARMRKARNLILPGLALFFLIVPTSWAGHHLVSPAAFHQETNPAIPDAAAIRGLSNRTSTGPNDVPVALVGWTSGDAAAFQAVVVSGLFRAFGDAIQPQARVLGVEIHAGGDAMAAEASIHGLVAETVGSATGPGASIVALNGSSTGSATGNEAQVQVIRALASGNAAGPDSLVRGATFNTTGSATGFESAVQSVRVRGDGNAVGTNSAVRGVDVTMAGVATGSGAEIRAIRAATTGTTGAAAAVHARTSSTSGRAVDARALATSGSTVGVRGQVDSPEGIGVHGIANVPGGLAGRFDGRVEINCTSPPCLLVRGRGVADLAENMVALGRVQPGDVVVLSTRGGSWGVARTTRPYDTRVAGIVSTQPRILLQAQGQRTAPVAMFGIITAKATASNAPIKVGDLLTTSSIPGHLMRCSTPARCIGAVVAKALQPLRKGNGSISVLVWRQ